jgi:predicted GNAT family acetyltransferase
MENEIGVEDAKERSRYEAHDADGNLMGFVNYQLSGTTITFLHSETLPAYRGRGVAGKVAIKSLDDAREAGLRVKPACPYYQGFLEKHPEYSDLLDAGGPVSL